MMQNRLKTITRIAMVVCIAALLLVNFSSRADAGVDPLPPSVVDDNRRGGGRGYQDSPIDYWEQNDPLPEDDGVYKGHDPDSDDGDEDIILPEDLLLDLCRMFYDYKCSEVGRDTTLLPVWSEDRDELYDPTETPTTSSLPGACFLAGTEIMLADGRTKAIEDIQVGDMILSFDEATKEFKPDRVKRTFIHPDEEGYLIVNSRIKATSNHPVYSAGQWKEIGTLQIGDELLNTQGKPERVTSIEYVEEVVTVYNLEINPCHTYIAEGVVVHNKIPGSPGDGP